MVQGSPFFLLDTTSCVPQEDPAPSSSPGRYNWVDNRVRDANLVIYEDDAATFLGSLPEPPLFKLIRLTIEARIFSTFAPCSFTPTVVYAWTFEIVCDYAGVYSSTTLFFHLFQVQLIKASKRKCRWVTLRNACEWRLFSPYTDTYKRRNFSFHYYFWRVVSRPRIAPFWRHPRTGVSFFNRWWTREHFYKNSSDYYVLGKQLNTTQQNLFKGPRGCVKRASFFLSGTSGCF
ncbi:hypothetical protein SESBI_23318 [Sesbania bispinosa]|nr:hypothetical protein SESBI_23318 [Sesbania bispinosa]